jgi:hypothetical protein
VTGCSRGLRRPQRLGRLARALGGEVELGERRLDGLRREVERQVAREARRRRRVQRDAPLLEPGREGALAPARAAAERFGEQRRRAERTRVGPHARHLHRDALNARAAA